MPTRVSDGKNIDFLIPTWGEVSKASKSLKPSKIGVIRGRLYDGEFLYNPENFRAVFHITIQGKYYSFDL